MKSKNSDSNNRRGFAAMDPDKRREAAKKGGQTSYSKEESLHIVSTSTIARGFAAMDEEKRKQIAKRGGSVSRRNRISSQEKFVIL